MYEQNRVRLCRDRNEVTRPRNKGLVPTSHDELARFESKLSRVTSKLRFTSRTELTRFATELGSSVFKRVRPMVNSWNSQSKWTYATSLNDYWSWTELARLSFKLFHATLNQRSMSCGGLEQFSVNINTRGISIQRPRAEPISHYSWSMWTHAAIEY